MGNIFASRHKKNPNIKMKNNPRNLFKSSGVQLQRLGKALMFPIAVLPIAALMNRLGTLMIDPTIGVVRESWIWWIGQFVMAPGAAVFNNIAIIFGIGVAFGLAKDNRGEAALCGGISYFILSLMTSENMVASLFYNNVLTFSGFEKATDHAADLKPHFFSSLLYVQTPFKNPNNPSGFLMTGTYVLNTGVIGGITCGALTAFLYNRYKEIQLPQALAFFGGRRFVPMIVVLSSFCLAFVFAALWPWIQYGLIVIGKAISSGNSASAGGAFVYGFLNRLLQPFGAHHILNTFLWFQLPIEGKLLPGMDIAALIKMGAINLGDGKWIVFGDINAFAGGIIGSGVFQSGFFPAFFGGIPATGLAMIMSARKSKQREVATFIAGVALVAFLTGIDEPLVFIWIFLSPLLLIIHALLTACFAALVVGMGIRLGFGFSAGLIDYLISLPKSWIMAMQHTGILRITSNPLWIFPISAIMGVCYYFIWTFFIKKLNIPTPGREPIISTNDHNKTITSPALATGNVNSSISITSQNARDLEMINKLAGGQKTKKMVLMEKYQFMAEEIVRLVGKDNFKVIENCATRLRLVVKDNKLAIDEQIKALGVYQIVRIGNEGLQLIIGTDVEHVSNRVRALVNLEN